MVEIRVMNWVKILGAWTLPVFLCCLPGTALAGEKDAIQEDLSAKTRSVEKEKRLLHTLTSKERTLYANLTEIEDRIQHLLEKKEKHKAKLKQAGTTNKELQRSFRVLQEKIQGQRAELKDMLGQLWTLYLHSQNTRFHDFGTWAETDLQFTWLSAIYRSAGDKLDQLKKREIELQRNLDTQHKVRAAIKEQYDLVQATQDKLLKSRLIFLRRLQTVRAQKLAKEEQLAQIKDTILELEYKLKAFESRQIAEVKGVLPWPVRGKLVKTYNPDADPPLEGLAFSATKGAKVKAIFWGKVVYSNVLRGFGKVVVIFHGKQYYSLYAFLSRAVVSVGQDVKKGEAIGHTGYYPLVNGAGLYFELRQGQSPVNPGPWLAKTG